MIEKTYAIHSKYILKFNIKEIGDHSDLMLEDALNKCLRIILGLGANTNTLYIFIEPIAL